jgi:YVTN family beta-propeller protein
MPAKKHTSLKLLCLLSALSLAACAKRSTGPFAYVTNERDGTISVIDLKNDRTVSTIRVGDPLSGLALDHAAFSSDQTKRRFGWH